MLVLTPSATASLLAAVVVGVAIAAGNPAWQIADDATYAMIADGYGLVAQPSRDIPHMHPLVGQAVNGLRVLGARFGYATYLYLCLWLGGAAIAYRFLKSRGMASAIVFLCLGIGPVVLLPQYTIVAGVLVAAAVVLWTTGRESPLTAGEWSYGFLLIFLAALFRIEMAILSAVCLSPVLLADARAAGRLDRSFIRTVALGCLAIGAGYYLTVAVGGQRLAGFYFHLKPLLWFLDYSYGQMVARSGMALPPGYSANDLALVNGWFFAYPSLVDPVTLNGLVAQVPFPEVLRQRAWGLLWFVELLPSMMFPWVASAAVVLAFISRRRDAILGGVAVFAVAALALAFLEKTLPERVGLGVALGLFLLAALTSCEGRRLARRALWTKVLAAGLLLPVGWSIIADRFELARQSRQFEKDVALLQGRDVIYSWSSGLPFRAGLRPFHVIAPVPAFVPLGSWYLLPQVAGGELARGCGGFVGCLVSGATVRLLASDAQVRLLETFFREHFGKSLVTVSQAQTPSFTLHELVAL